MYDYNFTRDLVNGMYNINNIERVDGEGNQIYLFHEIQSAISNNKFNIICVGENVTISFESELSSGEQSTLNTVVSNHKNNI